MHPARVEWPTVAVAAAIATGFAAVLVGHEALPAPALVVVLALLSGWYGSLQHEVIHGHPTPWPRLNDALATAPLGLVVRFADYRRSHLAHHAAPWLTDPDLDPESFYVTAETWERSGPVRRLGLTVMMTLAGRLVFGPALIAFRHLRTSLRTGRTPIGAVRLAGHVAGVGAVLAVVRASGLDVWVYVIGAAWGGLAVSCLRSFAEHRAVGAGTRSAVVRSGPAGSLLYLNNNLHHTHHARPGLAWFALPAAHDALGGDGAAADGAGWYRGYGELVGRYLFRPFDHPARRGELAGVR